MAFRCPARNIRPAAVWAKAAAPNTVEMRVLPATVATIPAIAPLATSESCKYNINAMTPIDPMAAPPILATKWDNRNSVVVTYAAKPAKSVWTSGWCVSVP